MRHTVRMLLFSLSVQLLSSCTQPVSVPKPMGALRLDIPASSFVFLNKDDVPFEIKIPTRTQYKEVRKSPHEVWFNLSDTVLNCTLFFTYKQLPQDEIATAIEESIRLVKKQAVFNSAIHQLEITLPEKNIYACAFEIDGDVPTPIQFYATNHSTRFLRGSLLVEGKPNRDSINPVVQLYTKEVETMLRSLEWK